MSATKPVSKPVKSNATRPAKNTQVRTSRSDSLILGSSDLTPGKLWEFAAKASDFSRPKKLTIAPEAVPGIKEAADMVRKIVLDERKTYGINTGFGYFADVVISPEELQKLQYNIIRSHCCGVQDVLPRDLALGLWLVNLNKLCQGHSGVRMKTILSILSHLQKGVLADIPSRGSVGASGDLAPLAHATRATIGEGMCTWPDGDGNIVHGPASEALKTCGLSAIEYGPKEGLSLVNGTALSTILAIKAWYEGSKLLRLMNMSAAMMTEALGGSRSACQDYTLRTHRHYGTYFCGRDMHNWLGDRSEMSDPHRDNQWIQDPYCIRCAPPVHGAVYTALEHAEEILADEINAATDNPLVFPEEMEVANCGHFHAIYPARVSDQLATAFTTLANIAERRINQAMCAKRKHLPTFLVKNGGVNSGFMMLHVTAAALVSEAKTQSFPASVDSIPTNIQQEDHVSMGPIAGYKALRVLDILRDVLAIELICATQAFDLQQPLKPAERMIPVYEHIRCLVPFLEEDRSLSENVEAITRDIKAGGFDQFITKVA